MLKLEKISRTWDINITVRQKDRKLNRPFLLALASAIGIHAFGAILFHIAPFKITYSESVIPPVAVAIDISGLHSQWETMAAIDEEKSIPPYLVLPINLEPTIPFQPPTVLVRGLSAKVPVIFKNNPFSSLDSERLPISTPPLEIAQEGSLPAKIYITGPLAGRRLKLQHAPVPASETQPLYALDFDIKVDDHSGKICWYQGKNKEYPLEILTRGCALLNTLRFEEDTNNFMTAGHIELLLPFSEGMQ